MAQSSLDTGTRGQAAYAGPVQRRVDAPRPWEASVRTPGLTIHMRQGDGYREEAASRAFPGWKAEKIHRALTEVPMSGPAWRALDRTALAMGAREGTKPEHNPLTRSMNAKARAKGHAQGHREGHAQGRMDVVAAVLRTRGIEVTSDLTEDPEFFRGLSGEALIAAALACTGEADFRRRIQEQRSLHAGLPPYPDPEE